MPYGVKNRIVSFSHPSMALGVENGRLIVNRSGDRNPQWVNNCAATVGMVVIPKVRFSLLVGKIFWNVLRVKPRS